MCFGSVKIPAAPKPPQPEDAKVAALRERQSRAGALGFGQTLLAGGLGGASGQASVAPKTLLGA